MNQIKIFSLKKILSFLLIFSLIFSQNGMIVFACTSRTKNTVKVFNNDNKTNNEKDKFNRKDDKNSSEQITSNFLYKENSNEKELIKETVKNDDSIIENNSSDNSIKSEKMQPGSYIITQDGIYPFTGDWGEEYNLEEQQLTRGKIHLKKIYRHMKIKKEGTTISN